MRFAQFKYFVFVKQLHFVCITKTSIHVLYTPRYSFSIIFQLFFISFFMNTIHFFTKKWTYHERYALFILTNIQKQRIICTIVEQGVANPIRNKEIGFT